MSIPNTITYIDRVTGQECIEKVYGARGLAFLYGDRWVQRTLGHGIQYAVSRLPLFSAFYGWLQKQPRSKKKIVPFIETYDIDASEFAKPVHSFDSFNDFFIRELKPACRPINPDPSTAILPADARYLCYQDVSTCPGIFIKGQTFELPALLGDASLAERYRQGTMIMARLCPVDYHRFHFPCACKARTPRLINGWLQSVNPLALKKNIHIFTENKRCITELESPLFGRVLYLEVGALCVGTIVQTFSPETDQQKGQEKGYFSFGASSLVLLFEPGKIVLDADLVEATQKGYEMRGLLGQSLGKAI